MALTKQQLETNIRIFNDIILKALNFQEQVATGKFSQKNRNVQEEKAQSPYFEKKDEKRKFKENLKLLDDMIATSHTDIEKNPQLKELFKLQVQLVIEAMQGLLDDHEAQLKQMELMTRKELRGRMSGIIEQFKGEKPEKLIELSGQILIGLNLFRDQYPEIPLSYTIDKATMKKDPDHVSSPSSFQKFKDTHQLSNEMVAAIKKLDKKIASIILRLSGHTKNNKKNIDWFIEKIGEIKAAIEEGRQALAGLHQPSPTAAQPEENKAEMQGSIQRRGSISLGLFFNDERTQLCKTIKEELHKMWNANEDSAVRSSLDAISRLIEEVLERGRKIDPKIPPSIRIDGSDNPDFAKDTTQNPSKFQGIGKIALQTVEKAAIKAFKDLQQLQPLTTEKIKTIHADLRKSLQEADQKYKSEYATIQRTLSSTHGIRGSISHPDQPASNDDKRAQTQVKSTPPPRKGHS